VRAGAAAAVAPRLRRPERGRRARTGRVGSTRPGGPRRTRRGPGSWQNQTQQPLWRNTSLGGPENLYKGCTCITSRNAESCVVDRSPNRTALPLGPVFWKWGRSGAHAGIVVDVPGRHELSDAEWALLAPLLPTDAPKGKKWADHRKIINAILFRSRTGIPWRDLPERYGPWETAAGRHRRWSLD